MKKAGDTSVARPLHPTPRRNDYFFAAVASATALFT